MGWTPNAAGMADSRRWGGQLGIIGQHTRAASFNSSATDLLSTLAVPLADNVACDFYEGPSGSLWLDLSMMLQTLLILLARPNAW